jgi:hypothetical protein
VNNTVEEKVNKIEGAWKSLNQLTLEQKSSVLFMLFGKYEGDNEFISLIEQFIDNSKN